MEGKTQETAAAKAGMSVRSARKWQSGGTMKTIKHTNTLVYYDGVQVFAGQDAGGDHYVGAMIDTVGNADRYLVVATGPDRCAGSTPATLTSGHCCSSPPPTAGTPHWWTTTLNCRYPWNRSPVRSWKWTICRELGFAPGKHWRATRFPPSQPAISTGESRL